MERVTEIGLIEELLGLREAKSHYLDDEIEFNSVDQYQSEVIFRRERDHMFVRSPAVAAHVSELPTQAILLSGRSPGDQSW